MNPYMLGAIRSASTHGPARNVTNLFHCAKVDHIVQPCGTNAVSHDVLCTLGSAVAVVMGWPLAAIPGKSQSSDAWQPNCFAG